MIEKTEREKDLFEMIKDTYQSQMVDSFKVTDLMVLDKYSYVLFLESDIFNLENFNNTPSVKISLKNNEIEYYPNESFKKLEPTILCEKSESEISEEYFRYDFVLNKIEKHTHKEKSFFINALKELDQLSINVSNSKNTNSSKKVKP